jgi:TM2 domain.
MDAEIRPSSRTWLAVAVCGALTGWFGAHRFYLGRYVNGSARLALFAAAVYCGMEAGHGRGIQRLVFLALAGGLLDLLMIALGPVLVRRRMLANSFFPDMVFISTHPVPRIKGTWVTLPVIAILLARLYIPDIYHGGSLFPAGFTAFSLLVGVYWGRDLVRIFYWHNLTDAEGRLPL